MSAAPPAGPPDSRSAEDPSRECHWEQDVDQLAVRLAPYGLLMTHAIKQRILRYCAQLAYWNRSYALLSRRDVESVLNKHVAASLGIWLLANPDPRERWVDVGTGAGLPGVILKAWNPEQSIVFVDGSRKKCVFLEHIVRELGVGSVTILCCRAETLVARGEHLAGFDVLFARAVADLVTTLREFGPLVRRNGRIITFKGPGWAADARAASAAGLLSPDGFLVEEVICVPWAPGHLMALRKIGT